MDKKLVSSNQSWEPKDVCRIFKDAAGKSPTVAYLKGVMTELARKSRNYKPGKLCRSRALIYAELEKAGYVKVPRKKKK